MKASRTRILIAAGYWCLAAAAGGLPAASPDAGSGAPPSVVTAAIDGAAGDTSCEAALDSFSTRQYRVIDVHRVMGVTTAGLVLAADGMGLYHFLHLVRRGHEIRDRIGYTEEATDLRPQTDGVVQSWTEHRSQTERVIHSGLIIASALSYTATATMKLTMPRTSRSQSPASCTRLHRYAFFLHAGLMAANIGLGIAESSALARGNHDLLVGAGAAHIAVGFSVPVVIMAAGGIFKLPFEY